MHRGRKRLAALRFVYLSVTYLPIAQAAQAACLYGGVPRFSRIGKIR